MSSDSEPIKVSVTRKPVCISTIPERHFALRSPEIQIVIITRTFITYFNIFLKHFQVQFLFKWFTTCIYSCIYYVQNIKINYSLIALALSKPQFCHSFATFSQFAAYLPTCILILTIHIRFSVAKY